MATEIEEKAMSMRLDHHGWWASLVSACLAVGQALGLTITSVNPSDYQTDPLLVGASYYTDRAETITRIPPALVGATLLRTENADASQPGLSVSFVVSPRAEVYVCYDSRAGVPSWLSSWVNTGMTVAVSDTQVGEYKVYARRFDVGTVLLSANEAPAMYFVVAKESLPILPRKGWVLLSYDMPYLREVIKHAPEYDVNHIQLSHDLVMNTYEVVEQPTRRADLNELIDLAHAYGVTEVVLWTHELCRHGMPAQYYAPANHPAAGHADGNNPGLWTWMQQRYSDLFTPGVGCPEVDGVVLTFSEVDDNVYAHGPTIPLDRDVEFKHDGYSPAESAAAVINAVSGVCAPLGKAVYPRLWVGFDTWARTMIRDGIAMTDTSVWMMHKNVGGIDWPNMDTYHELTGTLPSHKEMVEFDIGGEYMGHSKSTFVMTAYLKDHWNYALARGADGAVARIDREGDAMYYTANRLSMYGFKEILANPAADPRAINLAWCQDYFPLSVAQDIADHYDEPNSAWEGDTRYMTWRAYTSYATITAEQALGIAYLAIARIDQHQAALERQTTLDTRQGHSDYQTLRDGIATAIVRLGGTVPADFGFSNFRPTVTSDVDPDCAIDVRLPWPGVDISTASCEYSADAGQTWHPTSASCSGTDGSVAQETITASDVPFNRASADMNLIRFHLCDINGNTYHSDALTVTIVGGPAWTDFQPRYTPSSTPDCSVKVTAATGMLLDVNSGQYVYSVDGGNTWIGAETNWASRYECNQLPLDAGWYQYEGMLGYESVTDGILRIHDTGTSGGQKIKYAKNWNVSSGVGATVLARMRCVSGGDTYANNLTLADAQHAEELYLRGDGVLGLRQCSVEVPVSTSQWHTYRVTVQNADLMVYLDEEPSPLVDLKGGFTRGSGGQRLIIGSGSSPGIQDIYYDYVYWTTAGAFPPGQWRTAAFRGDPEHGTLTASQVPFNQLSSTLNQIHFSITDNASLTHLSPIYLVREFSPASYGDFDGDGDVDNQDVALFVSCISGSGVPNNGTQLCQNADLDHDNDVDQSDFGLLQRCYSGENVPADPNCAN
jgi:hypothetical protein